MNLRKHKKINSKYDDKIIYKLNLGKAYSDWYNSDINKIKQIANTTNYMRPLNENINLETEVQIIILDTFISDYDHCKFAVCRIVSMHYYFRIVIFKLTDLTNSINN